MRNLVVDHFLNRAVAVINGTDPRILALIARQFFLQALDNGPPKNLLDRWLFTVNSGDKIGEEQLRTMYFEAIANALKMTNEDAHQAIREAKEKYDSTCD